MRTLRTRSKIAAAGTVAAFAGLAMGQSIFTGASTSDPVNWCDPQNWFPPGVPVDGSVIDVPGGQLANMFLCDNQLRVLGPINAGGTIRFWTPVLFRDGGTLHDPIFDLSSTPAFIGTSLLLSGANSQWHGGIFQDGEMRNTGTLTVQHINFGGRSMPRALFDGHRFENAGTLRLISGFNIEDTSTLNSTGNIDCEGNVTIEQIAGTGAIQNSGSITVFGTRSLTLQPRLISNGTLSSGGSLTLTNESTILGTARVNGGGLIRLFAPSAAAVTLGPATFEGEGSIQILGGLTRFVGVTSTVGPGTSGRGLHFTSVDPIDFSMGQLTVNSGGLVTWSRGNITGAGGSNPSIDIQSGGRLDKVGVSGFGNGSGNAIGAVIRVAGEMYQYGNTQLQQGARIDVPSGGTYKLSHARLDGNGTGLVSIAGRWDINPPGDARPDPAFVTGTPVHLSGLMVVHANDLLTGINGTPEEIVLTGEAQVTIGLAQGTAARWRAFGETYVTGVPQITGTGIFELASGATFSVGPGAPLMALNGTGAAFEQRGNLRAEPGGDPGLSRFRNRGNWRWLGGSIAFPQSAIVPVTHELGGGIFTADCGTCQLRADLRNSATFDIIDTLTLAEQGVELFNDALILLKGHIAASAADTRIVNTERIVRVGPNSSSISATLDNQRKVEVVENTLTITGQIVQCQNGVLAGGSWEISNLATLSTPSCAVAVVGENAIVTLIGTGNWPQFNPRTNTGHIHVRSGNLSLLSDFENFGSVSVTDGTITVGGGRTYTQRGEPGVTRLESGGSLASPTPVAIEGGSLSGIGTVAAPAVNNTGGTVAPGASPGILTFTGDYTQSAAATLDIELAGYTPGAQHDVLAVGGIASLDGTLRVSLLDGFSPVVGDSFTVLTAPVITGTFATVTPPAGLSTTLRMAVDVGPSSVVVRFPCATDFNADGNIDPDDLGDFINCYFSVPPCAEADFNADGNTDPDDLGDFINVYFAGGC